MTEAITTLKLEDVYPNPKHYRDVRADKVADLVKRIEAAAELDLGTGGQLEPIRVWRDGEIYTIDSGHHRVAALKKLGRETVEAIISDPSDVAMVVSNFHVPTTPIEDSRGTQLIIATGIRPTEVAKLTGEKQDRVSKAVRALKVIDDATAAEDMTFDRLVAIGEFEDDVDAVKRLLNCTEDMWPKVARQLTEDRTRAENVVKAEAIVAASGCQLIEVQPGERPEGLSYLAMGDEVPEGATHAKIRTMSWNTGVDILWYGEATAEEEAPDLEAEAKREQAALIKAELEKAAVRRLEFVRDYLSSLAPGANGTLCEFAIACWEDNVDASVGMLGDDGPLTGIEGFMQRVHASILAEIDASARVLLSEANGGYNFEYYLNANGKDVVAYFAALAECGFTPTDVEAGLLVEIAEALKAESDAEVEADDGGEDE
jgi:ParB-like chromosome segregation protein Spo0J